VIIVLATGGFDPIHSGHIAYFSAAKELGDELWVAINSDQWLKNKKGKYFMPLKERVEIVKNLKMVDRVITNFDDSDGSACGAIYKAMALGAAKIIFANGGDRGSENTPEECVYGNMEAVEFVFGVGGTDKINSSSWILEEWRNES
jgi:D-beta-D-heptose 7-phosphate kinase/D-beta-D-heptose 1-phosphate adenosyltransferase